MSYFRRTTLAAFGLFGAALFMVFATAILLGKRDLCQDEVERLTQEATAECLKLRGSLQEANALGKTLAPRLRYDSGAAHVFVAMGHEYDELVPIHEYVVDIFRQEDPANFQRWEAHLIDHSRDCDLTGDLNDPVVRAIWHHGEYSIVVPDISLPALASLCQVLPRWGWHWPHQSLRMPEPVADAVRYPGRAELICIRAWHHQQGIPDWFFYERGWQRWETDILTAEAPFQELEAAMEFDVETWASSPWRHRPQLQRDLLGYAPGNE